MQNVPLLRLAVGALNDGCSPASVSPGLIGISAESIRPQLRLLWLLPIWLMRVGEFVIFAVFQLGCGRAVDYDCGLGVHLNN